MKAHHEVAGKVFTSLAVGVILLSVDRSAERSASGTAIDVADATAPISAVATRSFPSLEELASSHGGSLVLGIGEGRNGVDLPADMATISKEPLEPASEASERRTVEDYAKLPLTFVPNAGQIDAHVRYYAQGMGFGFYLTSEELRLAFVKRQPHASSRSSSILGVSAPTPTHASVQGQALALRFVNANPDALLEPRRKAPGSVNDFRGNDPARWRTGLASYEQVAYRELWPQIDMVLSGAAGKLKYEFRIRPGGRYEDIRLAYHGSSGLSLDARGNLLIETALGTLADSRPEAYQEIGGRRVSVDIEYTLQNDASSTEYGFAISHGLDRRQVLVIDPGLAYSTYLGGTNFEEPQDIKIDAAGNAYVVGSTLSSDFPTTLGAFDRTPNGISDVFVVKLDSTGQRLLYSTLLGGTDDDGLFGRVSLAIDAVGNAYVAGSTFSSDFPTTPGAFDQTFNGAFAIGDVFVTKLAVTGASLLYSTYVGGSDDDEVRQLSIDASGNVYLTGNSASSDFPTTPGAFDQTFNGNGADFIGDVFVTKLAATGASLLYSTYLGGADDDSGGASVTDAAGNVYVAGSTRSADFPITPGAADPTHAGITEAFVTKLAATGANLLYSTFLGGSGDEDASLVIDAVGNAYVSGTTSSVDFPTTSGAFDRSFNGVSDVFIAKLAATGTSLLYSTYLGGTGADVGSVAAIDGAGNPYVAGNAYVSGRTSSNDFPTTPGAFDRSFNGASDVFVTKLAAPGTSLLYSTYLGGTESDLGSIFAIDAAGNAYLAGTTASADFPITPGAFDTAFDGLQDVFVVKLAASGGRLLHSTYLGGDERGSPGQTSEFANGFALDAAGNVYVLGQTTSADFPTTTGAFDRTFNGSFDVFVTKLALGISCDDLSATIVGGDADDVLIGTAEDDVIAGLGGNDVILGMGGEDVICGGPGDDLIRSGINNDRLFGGPGSDRIYGNGGRDFVHGGQGDDTLFGGPGFDTLSGNEGDDLLDGGTENDRCDGGPQVMGDVAQDCEVVVDVP